MAEFKVGDEVRVLVWSSWNNGRSLGHIGKLLRSEPDDPAARYYVQVSGVPEDGRWAVDVELASSAAPESPVKLREPFIQFAMELVRNGDDVGDAIETARKLQEASE